MISQHLQLAVRHARSNPIKSLGRNSISRFGAILSDGKIVHKGWNSYKTHVLQARFGSNHKCVHLHAEVSSLIAAIRWKAKQTGSHYGDVTDLSEYSMYVARVLKNGEPVMSKPCEGCQRALMTFNIKHVEWTT